MKLAVICVGIVVIAMAAGPAGAATPPQLYSYGQTPTGAFLYAYGGTTLQQAPTDSGPWTTLCTLDAPSYGDCPETSTRISLAYSWELAATVWNLTPSRTYWYRVSATDASGTAYSNPVGVIQPPAAVIHLTQTDPGNGTLSWTNDAMYSPPYSWGVRFASYTVYNGTTSMATLTSLLALSYPVHGLSLDTNFSFSVMTSDYYTNGTALMQTVTSKSNVVGVPPRPQILSGAGTPGTGTAPLTVTFALDVRGGGTPIRFRWSFGDGGTSDLEAPTHLYESAGTYTATAVVTDSRGFNDSASYRIQVNPASSVSPRPPGNSTPGRGSPSSVDVIAVVAALAVLGFAVMYRRRRRT